MDAAPQLTQRKSGDSPPRFEIPDPYRSRREARDTEVAFARNEVKAGIKGFDNDAHRAGFRPGGQRPYCNARRYAGKAMWLLRRFGKGFVKDPA